MSSIQIEMHQVSKVYETATLKTQALRNINLQINQGDYISITGPSGCGKSTLLSLLGLLDEASSGQLILAGHNITDLSHTERAHVRNTEIGFIFQSFNLIDELNVFDNVALPMRYQRKTLSKQHIESRVKEVLNLVDMGHRIQHKPNQLSGGQQQRIAIARALVNGPKILLVDEATGNLDSRSGDQVLDILDELNQDGTTICMVTHDPRYADRARTKLHLLDGELINQVRLKEVM